MDPTPPEPSRESRLPGWLRNVLTVLYIAAGVALLVGFGLCAVFLVSG